MLKTLDILIGTTTVLLAFAMAVTVLTQAITTLFSRKGEHLKDGLTSLLRQLGIPTEAVAQEISDAILKHPMISEGTGLRGNVKLGTVIHREEFTKLLLAAANKDDPALWCKLSEAAQKELAAMLAANGVQDPAATLKNVRAMTLQLEASNPELATDVRQSLALLKEASSDYLALTNTWFDQTIDRVSQAFAKNTHIVTVALACVVVLTVQLDILAVMNRLSLDDKLRNQVVTAAANDVSQDGKPSAPSTGAAKTSPASSATQEPKQTDSQPANPATPSPDLPPNLSNKPVYDALTDAGLLTMPFISPSAWWHQFDSRKIPGMLLAILLVSLGAPFWYNILKDLLGLRSALAKKDDVQRAIRQTTQDAGAAPSPNSSGAPAAPAWLKGEQGNLDPKG